MITNLNEITLNTDQFEWMLKNLLRGAFPVPNNWIQDPDFSDVEFVENRDLRINLTFHKKTWELTIYTWDENDERSDPAIPR